MMRIQNYREVLGNKDWEIFLRAKYKGKYWKIELLLTYIYKKSVENANKPSYNKFVEGNNL